MEILRGPLRAPSAHATRFKPSLSEAGRSEIGRGWTQFDLNVANMKQGLGYTSEPPIALNLGGPVNHGPGFYKFEKTDFSPRISIAYSPRPGSGLLKKIFGENDKTVGAVCKPFVSHGGGKSENIPPGTVGHRAADRGRCLAPRDAPRNQLGEQSQSPELCDTPPRKKWEMPASCGVWNIASPPLTDS
jgi:hypothetical protein